MSIHQYTVNADGTFPNKKVDIARFTQEIQAGIAATLTNISIIDGNCVMTFTETLSNAQVISLETLVFAHSGTPSSPHTTGFTTTSTTYIDIPSLTITLSTESHRVRFSGSGFPQANNKTQWMAIFLDGTLVAGSERSIKSGGGQTAGMQIGFSCEAIVTTNGLQAITARLKSDPAGNSTAEIFNSTLTIGA